MTISSLQAQPYAQQISLQQREDDLGQILHVHRQITNTGACNTEAQSRIEPAKLARKWGIGLEAAKRTIHMTTQRGICTILHPSLSRRFRTNDRQL